MAQAILAQGWALGPGAARPWCLEELYLTGFEINRANADGLTPLGRRLRSTQQRLADVPQEEVRARHLWNGTAWVRGDVDLHGRRLQTGGVQKAVLTARKRSGSANR